MKKSTILLSLIIIPLALLMADCDGQGRSGASSFLFVQNFGTGGTIVPETIAADDGGADTFSLVITGDIGRTIFFSERPDRIVGTMDIAEFIALFNEAGVDSFANDPPNAVLEIVDGDGIAIAIVLLGAEFDETLGELIYSFSVLEEFPDFYSGSFSDSLGDSADGGEMSEEFISALLFIDATPVNSQITD